jgi:hypothetical protein
MWKLDTSWSDAVCDAIATLETGSPELACIGALFEAPITTPDELTVQVGELLGIALGDLEAYALRRAEAIGRDAWQRAGRCLLSRLDAARVTIEPNLRAVLELRRRDVRCPSCGFVEEHFDQEWPPDTLFCLECGTSLT